MRKFNINKVKFNKVFLIESDIVLFSRLYAEKALKKCLLKEHFLVNF